MALCEEFDRFIASQASVMALGPVQSSPMQSNSHFTFVADNYEKRLKGLVSFLWSMARSSIDISSKSMHGLFIRRNIDAITLRPRQRGQEDDRNTKEVKKPIPNQDKINVPSMIYLIEKLVRSSSLLQGKSYHRTTCMFDIHEVIIIC